MAASTSASAWLLVGSPGHLFVCFIFPFSFFFVSLTD